MDNFIKKNWMKTYFSFILIAIVVLVLIVIFAKGENCSIGAILFEDEEKRMDIIGTIIASSIAFASALVTIMLATVAIKYADNQARKEFKEIIQDRIKSNRDATTEIKNVALEVKYIAYNSLDNILTNLSDFYKYNKNINELEKSKNSLKEFAKIIKKLESNIIIKQHYLDNFNSNNFYEKYENKMGINTFNPKKIIDLSIQMEKEYIDKLPLDYIIKHISDKKSEINKIEKRLHPWIYFSILFGYTIGYYEDKEDNTNKLVGAITALDILINLPSTDNYINISEEIDKEFWKDYKEEVKAIIHLLSGERINEEDKRLKNELLEVRDILIKNFNNLLCYKYDGKVELDYDFNIILKIAKGIAIYNNSNQIEANHFFNALHYVNLNDFADNIFSQMMGEHYKRIGKADGGSDYIEIAEDNQDLPFDNNMKIFINEAQKHLNNKRICSIR